MDLKSTPLIDEHRRLNAQLGPFNGWLMPIQYTSILAEHEWTRTKASLFDICHMGEIFFSGDPLVTGLNKLVTAPMTTMSEGSCKYGFMLNERGGIRDDLVVYRLRRNVWMFVVNAGTAADDEAYLRSHTTPDITWRTGWDSIGKLDLQGPLSALVMERLAGAGIKNLKYYRCGYFDIMGKRMLVSRTGYTGELGFELYVPRELITRMWQQLLQYPEVRPAGLGARDTLRLEMGYPLYGQDIDTDTTPLQAGLGVFVDFTKDFVGKKALEASMHHQGGGVSRRLIAFRSTSRKSPRHNQKILTQAREEIGKVTSGTFSPSLGCGIGMGYAHGEGLSEGTPLIISDGTRDLDVVVADKPFYRTGTAKETLT